MKTVWTKGLEADHAKEVSGDYKGALILRKRLAHILDDKLSSAENGSRSKDGYDCPNWAYKQADIIGYKRALQEIISLISS
ncbi:hypothetical protein N9924_00745 [bacterium]|nr:hypothetical protein [bacterium]